MKRGSAFRTSVSIAGFDDMPLAHQIWPPLTTVCQPIYDIATTAARMLIGLLDRVAPAVAHVELPTHLIIRASTAPPASRLPAGVVGEPQQASASMNESTLIIPEEV